MADLKCVGCNCDNVHACVGSQSFYVCNSCYKKIQSGDLTLELLQDIKNGTAPKISCGDVI